jgi:hypothetical protein
MEIFPAADSTPWQLIRNIINDSDYYVLILGGRYGSVDENGLSYTQREYDLAVELKKPVLAFLHADPSALPVGKSEIDKKARKRLETFRKHVDTRHTRKYWRDTSDLRTQVIIALTWAIQTHPATGWVRAVGYNDEELLRRLASVQERFESAQSEIAALREQLGEVADASKYSQGDDKVDISFYFDRYVGLDKDDPSVPTSTVQLSWNEIFFGIGRELMSVARDYDLRKALSPIIFGAFSGSPEFLAKTRSSWELSQLPDQCRATNAALHSILDQFAALGLIEPQLVTRTTTDDAKRIYSTLEDGWRLTAKGRTKYFSAVAVRKASK